ncbi:hypothetical protein ABZ759_20100 [Streptomyces sp. NPDC047860]
MAAPVPATPLTPAEQGIAQPAGNSVRYGYGVPVMSLGEAG